MCVSRGFLCDNKNNNNNGSAAYVALLLLRGLVLRYMRNTMKALLDIYDIGWHADLYAYAALARQLN